jgi:hypothetical protein
LPLLSAVSLGKAYAFPARALLSYFPAIVVFPASHNPVAPNPIIKPTTPPGTVNPNIKRLIVTPTRIDTAGINLAALSGTIAFIAATIPVTIGIMNDATIAISFIPVIVISAVGIVVLLIII